MGSSICQVGKKWFAIFAILEICYTLYNDMLEQTKKAGRGNCRPTFFL